MKKTSYEQRLEEEKLKFCNKHNVQYEDLDSFVLWLMWFYKKQII
jgi:hypothetical protein